jgi:hypothetical protein
MPGSEIVVYELFRFVGLSDQPNTHHDTSLDTIKMSGVIRMDKRF